MDLDNIIGVRCDNISKGMFSDERTVYIRGKAYFVKCCNLVFDRQNETFYVKAVKSELSEEGILVFLNINEGVYGIYADESELVKKS